MNTVYVVDEDRDYAVALQALIGGQGYKVSTFATPHEFFYEVGKLPPSCALIGWNLPEMQGVDVVRRVRKLVGQAIGVMMITAAASEQDAVIGFEAGADDYIVRPTAANVLLARLLALMRRVAPSQLPLAAITVGPYSFDYPHQTVALHGKTIALTPREFDLAWTFFEAPSRLFTKQELLASIWGKRDEVGMHTIAQHVYAVRKKLSLVSEGFKLNSVYGAGYRLQPPLTRVGGDALPSVLPFPSPLHHDQRQAA